jgi:hypothetical protein
MKHLKTIIATLLLLVIIGSIKAVDTESYQFIDHLLSLPGPGKPEVFQDGVIFTFPASYRRVGIAFAHEDFGKVYWFQKLITRADMVATAEANKANPKTVKTRVDPPPKFLFYAYTPPADVRELEYRLIIDGLWTTDPANPVYRIDPSGVARSLVLVPVVQKKPVSLLDAPPGTLCFRYDGPPGESVTVAGDFNGWDPFMYELEEKTPGHYSLILPLPAGTYYYVFFYRGQRLLDPNNTNRIYTKEGKAASIAVLQ